MNTIITIFLVAAGAIALLLLMAFFMKREHYVRREIIINTANQKVFDFVKLMKNEARFNRHAMVDPDRKKEYKTESVSENQTKVSWSNSGTLNFPVNIMIPVMEKMLPKEMDASLKTLKSILENEQTA